MAIEFLCPECKSGLRVGDETAGKVVRCGSCMATVRVPAVAPNAQPPEPADDDPFERPRPGRRAAEPMAAPSESDRPRPRRRRPPPPKKGRGAVFWVLVTFGILAMLGLCTCGGVALMLQPKWRTHHSDAGGFKVDLPAPPRPDMRELAKLNNKDEVKIEGTVLLFHGEEFGVMYQDIDPTARELTDARILDNFVRDMKKDDPQVRVVRTRDLTVSGFPARELILTHPEGSAVCRIVVADTRLFVVWGGTRDGSAERNGHIRRFVDSFEVTDESLMAKGKQRLRERDAKALADAREELRETGEELADRVFEKADELREAQLAKLAELEEQRDNVQSAGRAAARTVLGVALAERAFAQERPDLPIAPPPRPRRND